MNLNLTSADTAPPDLYSVLQGTSSFLQLPFFTVTSSTPFDLSNFPLDGGWGGMKIGLTTKLSVCC